MTNNILLGADNPNGLKLEELLDELVIEMTIKTENLSEMDYPFCEDTATRNAEVIMHLEEAAALQRETLQVHLDYFENNPHM